MTGTLLEKRTSFNERSPMENIRYPVVMSENDRVWLKYCGFLDLDLPQFMTIQESLLLQQIGKAVHSTLGRKLIGDRTPESVAEYRHLVHLTDYEDYLPELSSGNDTALEDADAIIHLPQMVFEGIEDHLIDIASLLKPGDKPGLPVADDAVFSRGSTAYLGSQA